MNGVPRPAVVLGLLGLLPFLYGVALVLAAPGALPGYGVVEAAPSGGLHLLERFGAAILGFMGGCLWGFASAPGRLPTLALLGAASVPAFLALVAIRPDPAQSCLALAFGYVVLQGIDVAFHRVGVTPGYWLTLRLPLTAGVIACLLTGAVHG
jgi:hypothetical protein